MLFNLKEILSILILLFTRKYFVVLTHFTAIVCWFFSLTSIHGLTNFEPINYQLNIQWFVLFTTKWKKQIQATWNCSFYYLLFKTVQIETKITNHTKTIDEKNIETTAYCYSERGREGERVRKVQLTYTTAQQYVYVYVYARLSVWRYFLTVAVSCSDQTNAQWVRSRNVCVQTVNQ